MNISSSSQKSTQAERDRMKAELVKNLKLEMKSSGAQKSTQNSLERNKNLIDDLLAKSSSSPKSVVQGLRGRGGSLFENKYSPLENSSREKRGASPLPQPKNESRSNSPMGGVWRDPHRNQHTLGLLSVAYEGSNPSRTRTNRRPSPSSPRSDGVKVCLRPDDVPPTQSVSEAANPKVSIGRRFSESQHKNHTTLHLTEIPPPSSASSPQILSGRRHLDPPGGGEEKVGGKKVVAVYNNREATLSATSSPRALRKPSPAPRSPRNPIVMSDEGGEDTTTTRRYFARASEFHPQSFSEAHPKVSVGRRFSESQHKNHSVDIIAGTTMTSGGGGGTSQQGGGGVARAASSYMPIGFTKSRIFSS